MIGSGVKLEEVIKNDSQVLRLGYKTVFVSFTEVGG